MRLQELFYVQHKCMKLGMNKSLCASILENMHVLCGLHACWLWKRPDFCFLSHNLPKKELEKETGCFRRQEMQTNALNFRTEQSETGLKIRSSLLWRLCIELAVPRSCEAWVRRVSELSSGQTKTFAKLMQKWRELDPFVWHPDP